KKYRHDATEPRRLVQTLLLGHFDVAHQARIVDPFDGPELQHGGFLLLHTQTLSAHRSLALRDRGFALSSCSLGRTTCLVRIFSVPWRSASRNASFTIRSSLEWYVKITHRPCEFIVAGTRERNCPSSSISRFTAIRSARNV